MAGSGEIILKHAQHYSKGNQRDMMKIMIMIRGMMTMMMIMAMMMMSST